MPKLTMIVEDDSATRDSMGGLFTFYGWDVCLAPTLAEALTLLAHGLEPDFLILDLRLPDGDGEAVLKAVKDRGLRTRVIVCSGAADDPLRLIRLREMNPDLTLVKPIDPDIVVNLCERAVW